MLLTYQGSIHLHYHDFIFSRVPFCYGQFCYCLFQKWYMRSTHVCTHTWRKTPIILPCLACHSWGISDRKCCVLRWLKDQGGVRKESPLRFLTQKLNPLGTGLVSFIFEIWPVPMLGYFSFGTIFKVPHTFHTTYSIHCSLSTNENLSAGLLGVIGSKIREESGAWCETLVSIYWDEQATEILSLWFLSFFSEQLIFVWLH